MSMADDEWVLAIRAGEYEQAWDITARQLAARDPRTRDDPSLPYHLRWVWDGRPFEDRHVLVRCYHGLGDTIQFARYLPLLRRHAASVTLEVQPRLACLFTHFPGVDRLIPFDPARPSPQSECDLEIMELAFALRAPPSKLPPPCLRSPPAVLPRGTIGLCHEAGDWDRERCLAAADLLAACGAEPCLTLVCGPTGLPVLNPEGCPFDIEATAMLVAGLDLVVTVDTFIAHLAGAMGKPVWLLLKHEPDWRWSPTTRRSDWYPSMRLYSQPAPGDWDSVLAEVARDLAERGRSDRTCRTSG
jgi:ADP-heptose:LPS heptosyltransferase